jgi:hypothetical protein
VDAAVGLASDEAPEGFDAEGELAEGERALGAQGAATCIDGIRALVGP